MCSTVRTHLGPGFLIASRPKKKRGGEARGGEDRAREGRYKLGRRL